ncbi:MAG TPA: hypothetical protein VMO78_10260 [Rhizomicrobium sp.]|nr:hypothetical protein [Rhizomicrobium sp.]
MRKYWILLSVAILAACHKDNTASGYDTCQAPAQPKLLTVAGLTTDQKADAMGIPPSQVPPDAAGGPAFEDYVARHNGAVQTGYCVDNEAYKARAMKDEMSSVARAIMATCHEGAEPDTLATVLKYRNCAAGNK